jgi:hypothetical protein
MFSNTSVEELCTAIAAALDEEIEKGCGAGTYSSLWSIHGLDLPGNVSGFAVRCEAEFDEHPLEALFGVRVEDPEVLGVVLVSEASAFDARSGGDERRDVRVLYVLLRDGTETALLHHHDAPFSPVDTAGVGVNGRVSCAVRRVFGLASRAGECGPVPRPQELAVRRALTLALMLHELAGDHDVLVEGVQAALSVRCEESWEEEYTEAVRATRAALALAVRARGSGEVMERRLAELLWMDPELFALLSHENTPSTAEIRAEIGRRIRAGSLSERTAAALLEVAGQVGDVP